MQPIIHEVAAAVSFCMALAMVVFQKEVLDKNKVIDSFPIIKSKLLRFMSALSICCLLLVAFEPHLIQLGSLVFIGLVLLIMVYIAYDIKQHELLLEIHYPTIGIDVYLTIPTDRYKEVAPGVKDRRLTSPYDLITEKENQYADLINNMDFENNVVVFVEFTEEGDFEEHAHPTLETIYMLEGDVVMFDDQKVYQGGDVVEIPAKALHIFKCNSSGCALIALAKK